MKMFKQFMRGALYIPSVCVFAMMLGIIWLEDLFEDYDE